MIALLLSSAVVEKGDVLVVRVFGSEDYFFEIPVLSDCSAYFPLVGNVEVCGMTLDSLSSTLRTLLKPYYNLPVIITFKTTSPPTVVVLGEVQKPGSVPYMKGMTLADALSLAGALPSADLGRVKLNGKTVNLNEQNPHLKPGDRINVPKTFWASARENLPLLFNVATLGILVYNTFLKR